ncbi:MAG: ribose-phosphate pyrophosphokinase [Candidatus Lindowbacteria bacterium RIFCSPLOWO2_12_FULL_62_27]|nr:MAG: ribose-phosphate pyrophosphokinase [Candidatus Lindowbacteria bacterium RIFCSPLOWO2_12_FULL_62_27]OGH58156.1 MAG: ribose-phosphate pyrophosphokinase [Candidatus Lindowbacteria bacterium RIFCSPLOWO2_02_FULL_62_12]
MATNNEFKIFTCSSNSDLAQKIVRLLRQDLGKLTLDRFRDGEIRVKFDESVRGKDVFLIQSTCPPVSEHLMEILLTIDAAKRASAGRITAVMPYFGYARQDRKDVPRVPISAKLVADLIATAGADRVLAMDLHVDQLQGFFDIPVDHIFARPVMHKYFQKSKLKTMLVSPDTGGVERSRNLAEQLGVPLAIIDKRRTGPNQAEVMNIVGEVKGFDAILLDDIIDTGGTVVKAAEALMRAGAKSVRVACTHPVFSGSAPEILQQSPLAEVVVTDTIPLPRSKHFKKLTVVSVSKIFADAISRIHLNRSFQGLI